MEETFRHLETLKGKEPSVVMATLVATRGTTPKREGAKMWVGRNGRVLGSVTIGGCVDARVIRESEEILDEGRPRRVEMSLSDEEAWDLGMTCGGVVDLLLEPVDLTAAEDPVVRAYETIRRELEAGRRAVAVTPLASRVGRLVVGRSGALGGTLGDEELDAEAAGVAGQVLEEGRSRIVGLSAAEGPEEFFLELHAPPVTLVVFGAGNVAIPLVRVAKEVGWRVVVVDNRARFATRERFPEADELRTAMVSEVAAELRYGPTTAVVVVAHDYKYEVPILKEVLAGDASYVGVLGSRRRGAALLEFLEEAGVDRERLDRVRVPVGLDLGAETAAEIAVSIVSEILAVRSGAPGTPLAHRDS